jgi:hypothetical protein
VGRTDWAACCTSPLGESGEEEPTSSSRLKRFESDLASEMRFPDESFSRAENVLYICKLDYGILCPVSPTHVPPAMCALPSLQRSKHPEKKFKHISRKTYRHGFYK